MTMSVHRPADEDDLRDVPPKDEAVRPLSISKNDAFHILQNSRRRAVLRFLCGHPHVDRFRMRTIAEEVAAWEHDTTVQQLTSNERQRVYIALYQSHLPKLDEHDIITYNQSRGVVERTALTQVLEPYVEDGLHEETELTAEPLNTEDEPPTNGFTDVVSNLFHR
jgi:hypothetical protein